MATLTERGKIIRMFCEEYPGKKDLTLAKLIFSSTYGDRWPSVDAIRNSIRYHRGHTTNGSGSKNANPIDQSVDRTQANMASSKYTAPKSLARGRADFEIYGAQRILRLSDIHFPIHDEAAVNAALRYGQENDPTIILLDGDIADLHDFSSHEKTTMMSYVLEEVQMVVDFLDALRRMFPKARIIYKEGNHEDRLTRFLFRKAPELLATDCFNLPSFFSFISGRPDAFERVEWVCDKRIIRAGELAFLHGHEFRGGGGVNPARWLYLRTGGNAICGHFHRTSEHAERGIRRQSHGVWSTGCLCDLSPDYLPHNNWNHGFAWIDVEQNGQFRVKNIRIIDGVTH